MIKVLNKSLSVRGDAEYLGRMGEVFEEDTTSLLIALCNETTNAIDVGANIGLTSIALSQVCTKGKVIAIEPVPQTFGFLESNIEAANASNVSLVNIALGAASGSVDMFVNDNNLAASFVTHTNVGEQCAIRLATLDQVVCERSLPSVDFIKIDVEGFELEVLRGASDTLSRFRPIVLLEMNHWCLNVFQKTALPVFREELLRIFDYVYAFDSDAFLDFSDPLLAGQIYHAHVFENKYMHIVAGFDKDDLVARLHKIASTCSLANSADHPPSASHNPTNPEEASAAELQLHAVLNSTSWKITAPLRLLMQTFRSGRKK